MSRLTSHERWAHLRFSVVGPLLASPPGRGELREELQRLAQKEWRHPVTGEGVRFAVSTIERWYYAARSGEDPVGVLRRKPRSDRGRHHGRQAGHSVRRGGDHIATAIGGTQCAEAQIVGKIGRQTRR